jgi:hypothetical protein
MTETITETIEACEKIIADLEAQRAKTAARAGEISQLRQSCGYDAHAGEGAKSKEAKAQLAKLNAEYLELSGTCESLDGALITARAKLAAATAAHEKVQAAENAIAIRKLLASFVEAARDADAGLRDFSNSAEELRRALNAIHIRGCEFPTTQQLLALGKFALLTHLGRSPWAREFEVIPPSARREFEPLVRVWVETIENNYIKPRLGEPEQSKDEADEAA